MKSDLEHILGSILKMPGKVPAHEVAKEIYLTPEMSPGKPGYYDPNFTPFVKKIIDFPQQSEYKLMGLAKSSQFGGTLAYLASIWWKIKNDPAPCAIVIDALEEIRKIGEIRIKPMLEQLGGDFISGDEEDLEGMSFDLNFMNILLGTGSSARIFENKALDFFILDEVREHKLNKGKKVKETTLGLAEERLKTMPSGKMLAMGKLGDYKDFWHRWLLKGTWEHYHVPCPYCGERFPLEPEGLKFDHHKDLAGSWDLTGVLEDTKYVCPECEELIHCEEHRSAMVGQGEWVAHNENPFPGRCTLRMHDMYSPFITWGELGLLIIDGANSPEVKAKVQVHNFARPYKPDGTRVEKGHILNLRSGLKCREKGGIDGPVYRMGQDASNRICPIEPVAILTNTDVQLRSFKALTVAVDKLRQLWLIDYREVLSFEDVADLYFEEYEVLGSDRKFPVTGGLIDARDGNNTVDVINFCRRMQAEGVHLHPSMGGGGTGRLWSERTTSQYSDMIRYDYIDKQLKSLLYLSKIAKKGTPRLYMPTDIDEHPELVGELTAENLERKVVNNKATVYEWVARGKNDYGDALKMGVLLEDILFQEFAVGEEEED